MAETHTGPLTYSQVKPGAGLSAALKLPRTGIISVLADSALKGRGGAGFPTSVKWNLAAAARGE
jgi:[NiFe] hydrogenase diaphorase moiety large subunit